MQQTRTIRLSGRKSDNKDQQPFAGRGVTVIAPGTATEVAPGRSVRETLAAIGISPPSPRELVRVGREKIDDLERILEPGEIITVVKNIRAG